GMRAGPDLRRGAVLLAFIVVACLPSASALAASPYPAGAQRPSKIAQASEFANRKPVHPAREASAGGTSAGGTTPATTPPASTKSTAKKPAAKKPKKPKLPVDAERAQLAFEAMQKTYYIEGSGLYKGEPFSFLWPFSQALAATVSIANVPALKTTLAHEINARLAGLKSYLDLNNSGAPEGTYASTLAAYDGTVAPPTGPGGLKYYDDNAWVGIELARMYELTHVAGVLGGAEGIMAFEMAGWDAQPGIACPGGIPFSNSAEDIERNTVTNAPTAELGLQLYRLTGNAQYLQFAEMAYEWVRTCLTEPNGLYADHIGVRGKIEPEEWSYNQGAMIGAGVLLYQATGNSAYLYQARQTAKAALAYYTSERLGKENPFFVSVYFRNMLYLDSVTHDPPGTKLVQGYVNYAWEHLRLSDDVFVFGSPASAQLLVQAAIVQDYALLSTSPTTYF
ncbi:MAG TPA: glycoside hydrolase family 76 protein, partial [Solirubrobacteraceae bacterium]